MGREVRIIPRNWEHPKNYDGRYIPKHYGWDKAVAEFQALLAKGKSVDYALRYFGGPNPHDYMDADWLEDGLRPELLCMYEDTSEGTPISPGFETAEQLATWLVDNNASAFAGQTATYEQWLAMIKSGWAVSAVLNPSTGEIKSGVAALHKPTKE